MKRAYTAKSKKIDAMKKTARELGWDIYPQKVEDQHVDNVAICLLIRKGGS